MQPIIPFEPHEKEILGLYEAFRPREYERETGLETKDLAWRAVIMAQLPHRRRKLWGLISYPTPYRQAIIDATTVVPEMAGRWAAHRGADPEALRTAYMLIYGRPFPF